MSGKGQDHAEKSQKHQDTYFPALEQLVSFEELQYIVAIASFLRRN